MSNASCADLVGAVQQQSNNVMSPLKKRASTVELNGKCYLAIEPEARDARTARNPLEPSVYRGGVGTVPRDRYFSMISYFLATKPVIHWSLFPSLLFSTPAIP